MMKEPSAILISPLAFALPLAAQRTLAMGWSKGNRLPDIDCMELD